MSTMLQANRAIMPASAQRATCVLQARARPRSLRLAINAQQPSQATTTTTPPGTTSSDEVPAGCSRYTVKLTKPLGIVLDQDTKTKVIKVAEILPTGSAAKNSQIQVGDQLIATSGVTYARVDDYGGAAVRGGQEIVRLTVQGETMKTVSAAIGSHPGHIPVTLEFQKCDSSPAGAQD